MKIMKDQIEKILEDKIELSLSNNYKSVYIDGVDNASQAVKDHMIEFIDWFASKDSPVTVLYGDQKERFASTYHDYTIEELYNFWYSNVYLKTKKG